MSYSTQISAPYALTGVQLARPTRCRCQPCGTPLREGDAATAYAYQPVECDTWSVPRLYCRDCAPDAIATPTLGVHEALADAWLAIRSLPAARSHRLVLADVEVRATSAPDDGAEP